ncbi:MAG: sugar ABC transporter permease, partial [Clostridia bacterium]
MTSAKNELRAVRRGGYRTQDTLQFMMLVLPTLVLLLLFNYLPMFGIVMAFQDFTPVKGFLGSKWVGFENFEFFFKSQDA